MEASGELLQSLGDQFEFSFIICASVEHDKTWKEAGSKSDYDLWVITDGEVFVEMEGERYVLRKGDVFFFYPQTFYSAHSRVAGCSFVFVRFKIAIAENLLPLSIFNLQGHFRSQDISAEASIFMDFFDKYQNKLPMSALSVKAAVIMLVAKTAEIRIRQNSAFRSSSEKAPHFRLEKLLSFIAGNLHQPLSIPALASFMNMSEKYFIVYFKRTMGITPHNYISRLKLRKAFDYLSGEKYSVKETAGLLGYCDQYAFSKAFKRYFGFSPSKV